MNSNQRVPGEVAKTFWYASAHHWTAPMEVPRVFNHSVLRLRLFADALQRDIEVMCLVDEKEFHPQVERHSSE